MASNACYIKTDTFTTSRFFNVCFQRIVKHCFSFFPRNNILLDSYIMMYVVCFARIKVSWLFWFPRCTNVGFWGWEKRSHVSWYRDLLIVGFSSWCCFLASVCPLTRLGLAGEPSTVSFGETCGFFSRCRQTGSVRDRNRFDNSQT
jgi:hypothetical protein